MSDISQEQALALLEEAMGKNKLDLFIKKGPTEFIGAEARPKVKEALEAPVAAETSESENLSPELAIYKQEYDRMFDDAKERCAWKTVAERLFANNGEKLKLAQSMQGGGELFGIDSEGRALFKDKGVEPVMYGFDKDGKLLQIYDRDQEQMKQVQKWADYFEIREQVLKDGYELFADDNCYGVYSDEMRQATEHTRKPFVASRDRDDWRASWLESGDRSVYARRVYYSPYDGDVHIDVDSPEDRGVHYGAVRLLRV